VNTKRVIEVLNDMKSAGVIQDYAIAGAVGAAVYVEPFFTKDLDVFVTLGSQAGPVIDLSGIYGYLTSRGFEPKGQWVVIGGWDVEFLPPYGPLTERALHEANVVLWEDTPVRVVRAEYLVAICLEAGRMKDHERIARFVDQEAFDSAVLKRILGEHGLSERWEAFMRRYRKGEP
jgi:hypothetical protein